MYGCTGALPYFCLTAILTKGKTDIGLLRICKLFLVTVGPNLKSEKRGAGGIEGAKKTKSRVASQDFPLCLLIHYHDLSSLPKTLYLHYALILSL